MESDEDCDLAGHIAVAGRGGQKQPARDMVSEKASEGRDHWLFVELQRAARVVTRSFDDALRPLSLTSGQFTLLISLDRAQPARIGPFASLLGMDRTILTAMLKPLKRRGLVVVTIDPEDRRGRLLSLTQRGKTLLADATPPWDATHAQLEQRLNDASIKSLQRECRALSRAQ